MRINGISRPYIYNIAKNQQYNKSLFFPAFKQDTVSFSNSTTSLFLYPYSWYLKNEKIIAQDDFSTTIEDRSVRRSLKDIIKGKKYQKKIYDLPLRLREELSETNKEIVNQNTPVDILDKTGQSESEFIKDIEKINSFIALVYPRYDRNEDETRQEFKIEIGNSIATVTRIRQGMSGIIYKIAIDGCKPLCLKHFTNINDINMQEGAFPEIAIAKKLNEDNVKDIPLLYYANPYNGWMLSEYITSDYESRKDGIPFAKYMEDNNLVCNDVNDGMKVAGKDSLIYVDFGYISSKNSEKDLNDFNSIVVNDKRNRVNSKDYISDENISLITKAQNLSLYGSEEFYSDFIDQYYTTQELQFIGDIGTLINKVLSGRRIPVYTHKQMQREYEKLGFSGDIIQLINSCNQ